jgi:hypothetical protein
MSSTWNPSTPRGRSRCDPDPCGASDSGHSILRDTVVAVDFVVPHELEFKEERDSGERNIWEADPRAELVSDTIRIAFPHSGGAR